MDENLVRAAGPKFYGQPQSEKEAKWLSPPKRAEETRQSNTKPLRGWRPIKEEPDQEKTNG